ncbi:winged helix DNA-binding domain-containing protein [Amycolatopsis nigrescens]|uniref:winged helix DNA-binding domain-containing protein n=1 Tax=Amycolatopsis nigrescens TaxID=381445 RepID=UPI00036AC495|nr:winged helix DNA-binding domain-containing protein [Amycolatopsis nigrescens]
MPGGKGGTKDGPLEVGNENVLAFRVAAQHLNERLAAGSTLDAAGNCALQDSPPGSAALALHARVADVGPDTIADAVEDRGLFHTWSMRGSPFVFPTADLAVFTTGVLPPGESARRHFILGVEQSLEKLELSLAEVTDLTKSKIRDVLAGRRLAINELGAELAQAVAGELPKTARKTWDEEGPHAKGQPLGEAVVHFCLRILTLEQIVCFAHRDGKKLPFVLVDEWLDARPPAVEAEVARAELVRRYLHCYGPSTAADFAAWLGVAAKDAAPWWKLVEDEISEVRVHGRVRSLLAEDVPALRSPAEANGVRLLPPRDPLVQLRDRESLVPDKRLHREIWKTVGEPGTVLCDGHLVATWRPRKNGKKLTLTVTAFDSLTAAQRKAIDTEAEGVASIRGCSSVEVAFDS